MKTDPNAPERPDLTKREAFAMAALQGLCADYGDVTSKMSAETFRHIASMAVGLADATIAALNNVEAKP